MWKHAEQSDWQISIFLRATKVVVDLPIKSKRFWLKYFNVLGL